MAILSFLQDDASIFVNALATEQRLEVKSKLGVLAQLFRSLLVRVYSHRLISMHLHGSRLKRIFVSHLKTLHTHRTMSCTLQTLTPDTSTPPTF